jgi:uncharacterized protein YcfJ
MFAVVAVSLLSNIGLARADHDESEYAWAKVVNVDPIYRVVRFPTPKEECYQDEVRTWREPRRYNVAGSTFFGAAVGGLLGSTFARGDARIATTAGGALIGAALGNGIAQGGNRHSRGYEDVRYVNRCRVVQHVREERVIDGYWVDYKFRGRIYRTQMEEAPGSKIWVRITVDPVAR